MTFDVYSSWCLRVFACGTQTYFKSFFSKSGQVEHDTIYFSSDKPVDMLLSGAYLGHTIKFLKRYNQYLCPYAQLNAVFRFQDYLGWNKFY